MKYTNFAYKNTILEFSSSHKVLHSSWLADPGSLLCSSNGLFRH